MKLSNFSLVIALLFASPAYSNEVVAQIPVDDDFVENDGYDVKQDESEQILAHEGYWLTLIVLVAACIALGVRNRWKRNQKGYDQLP